MLLVFLLIFVVDIVILFKVNWIDLLIVSKVIGICIMVILFFCFLCKFNLVYLFCIGVCISKLVFWILIFKFKIREDLLFFKFCKIRIYSENCL